MKKIATFVCAAFAALIMASCSSNSPKGVVEKFLTCTLDKDSKGMVECLDYSKLEEEGKTPEEIEKVKEGTAELIDSKLSKLDKNDASFKILSEETAEDGNNAVVEVELSEKKDGETVKETQKMNVVKDKKGNWKIKM